MGLRRITGEQFPISPEEWQRRQMRIHNIKRWLITLIEIGLMVGAVMLTIWVVMWATDQIHP